MQLAAYNPIVFHEPISLVSMNAMVSVYYAIWESTRKFSYFAPGSFIIKIFAIEVNAFLEKLCYYIYNANFAV